MSFPSPQDTLLAILKFVTCINECLQTLKSSEKNMIESCDTLFLFVLDEKLSENLLSWWECSLKKDEIGSLEQFIEFLKGCALSLINSKLF